MRRHAASFAAGNALEPLPSWARVVGSSLIAMVCLTPPATAEDLMHIYQQALQQDARYASARYAREAGQEKKAQGKAGLLPLISLQSGITRSNVDNGSLSDRYNSTGYTLQLSQPLFRKQNWLANDQSERQFMLSELRLAKEKQDLILRVAQAYFDVLLARDTLASVRAEKVAVVQQLELAKKSFEVGTATITDSQEAQARHDVVSASEIAADSDLEVKERALDVLLNKDHGELSGLKEPLDIPVPVPPRLQDWLDAAAQGSLAVQMQEMASDLARLELERQQAGHYPTLDLVASHGDNHRDSGTLRNSSLGVQLNIPLYQGGATDSRIREARALLDAARADVDLTRRQAVLDTRQAYLGVVNGLSQIKALEAALRSSRLALESNKLGYEVGVRINIDVLNAEQQVHAAQRNLSRARIETLMSQLRLKAAVGSLSEADVDAINRLLKTS